MRWSKRFQQIAAITCLYTIFCGCERRNIDVSLIPASSSPSSVSSQNEDAKNSSESNVKTMPDLTQKPEKWDFYILDDYEPYVEQSSGLYKEIFPFEDFPHKRITVMAFDGKKAVFEYAYDTYGTEGGGPPLKPGKIVIYDLETGEYISAGERFPDNFDADTIIMKSHCYYAQEDIDASKDDFQFRVKKIDLSTGKDILPSSVSEDYPYMRGYISKVDDTHFIFSFDREGQTFLYDIASDSYHALPEPFPKELEDRMYTSLWNGKVYWEFEQLVERKSWRFQNYIASYDLATGEEKGPFEIEETQYILPGQPLSKFVNDDEELTFHSHSLGDIYWLAWGRDGSVRKIVLAHPERYMTTKDRLTQLSQNTGIIYFWEKRDHLLFLLDIVTNETRVLDIGYREDWSDVSIFPDEEGNIFIHFEIKDTFYWIPKSTIEQYAVDIENFS